MITFGERLRSERDRLGLNQTDFGKHGGVQRNTQANYETGERVPDAAYLTALIPFGVDVWFVLTGERFPAAEDSITGPSARLLALFESSTPEAQAALLGVAEVMSATKP